MVIYSVHHLDGTTHTSQNIPDLVKELSPRTSYQFSGTREHYDAFIGVCVATGFDHSNVFFSRLDVRITLGYITAQEYC